MRTEGLVAHVGGGREAGGPKDDKDADAPPKAKAGRWDDCNHQQQDSGHRDTRQYLSPSTEGAYGRAEGMGQLAPHQGPSGPLRDKQHVHAHGHITSKGLG